MKITLEKKDDGYEAVCWFRRGRGALVPTGSVRIGDIQDDAEQAKLVAWIESQSPSSRPDGS